MMTNLFDYSDIQILDKGTTAVSNTAAQDADNNAASKKNILKLCAIYQLHKQNKQYASISCS